MGKGANGAVFRLFDGLAEDDDGGRGRQPNRGRGHLPRDGKKRSRKVPGHVGEVDPNWPEHELEV